MKAAIRDNDPVFVMENTILYGEKWEVPEEEYIVEIGVANILKEGADITIVSHGRCAMLSLNAAKTLKEEHDTDAEVVDLRSIRPLDVETILNSVRKTNRVVLVEARDALLAPFHASSQRAALDKLRASQVEVRLEETVAEVTDDHVRLASGEELPTRTVIWAAGVQANPLAAAAGPKT